MGMRLKLSVRRLSALSAVGALSIIGLVGVAAPASAQSTNVSGAYACFGTLAGSGGCEPGFYGSTSAEAGTADSYFDVALTTPSALTESDTVTIDASTGAPGMQFPSANADYFFSNDTTNGGCSIYQGSVSTSNNGQTVTVPVPPLCAATSGQTIDIQVDPGVTNPATAGVVYVQLSSTPDPNPVSTNNLTLTSVASAPVSPHAGSGNGYARIGWTPPTNDGELSITGYDVYCSTTNPPSTGGTPTATAPSSANSVTITGLTNGKKQYCVVTAVNGDGQSAPSSVVSTTPHITVPAPPVSVKGVSGDGAITVKWKAPRNDGGDPITGYKLYCSTTNPPATSGTPTKTLSATTLSARVKNLPVGTLYYCVVTTVTAKGQSKPSKVVQATSATVPGAPTSPSVSAVPSGAVVSWSPPASDGGEPVLQYLIYCSTTNPPSTSGAACGAATSAQATYISGLTGGVLYYFVVTAINQEGASRPSPVFETVPMVG